MTSQTDRSLLDEPITFAFSQRTSPNRFSKAAMTERLCTYSDDELSRGEPTKELENVYTSLAKGGLGAQLVLYQTEYATQKMTGLFHTGNIMVHRRYIEAKGCVIIDPDIPKSYVPALKRLQQAVKTSCPKPPLLIGQLAHVSGQTAAILGHHPLVLADEDVQIYPINPAQWTQESISDIVNRFAFAAGILKDAGFDGIQIHGAYGYFITKFLSRHTNSRTDEYGGPLENRLRVLLSILTAIKDNVNDSSFILGVKINATDFKEGGLIMEEVQQLASSLEEAQVDYIELSGGTYERMIDGYEPDNRQSHFLRFASQLRSGLTRTKLIVTGGFTSLESMARAVRSGSTDFVGLARSLAHEPNLPSDILSGRALSAKANMLPSSTAVNLEAGIFQIQRMGKGLPLLDFSDKEVAQTWMNERDC